MHASRERTCVTQSRSMAMSEAKAASRSSMLHATSNTKTGLRVRDACCPM